MRDCIEKCVIWPLNKKSCNLTSKSLVRCKATTGAYCFSQHSKKLQYFRNYRINCFKTTILSSYFGQLHWHIDFSLFESFICKACLLFCSSPESSYIITYFLTNLYLPRLQNNVEKATSLFLLKKDNNHFPLHENLPWCNTVISLGDEMHLLYSRDLFAG